MLFPAHTHLLPPMTNPKRTMPPVEDLRRIFRYDPETGTLTPPPRARSKDFKRIVRFNGQTLLASRVAYALHTGEDLGTDNVEQLDGNPANLRPANLQRREHNHFLKTRARRNNLPPSEKPSGYKPDAKTAPKPLPDIETLNRLFHYDPETGILTWKVGKINRHAPQREIGSLAGSLNSLGYFKVRVGFGIYSVHRIVWKMHHGTDPGRMQVDHRNGDPSDNRISNLRLATPRDNMRNTPTSRKNTSGYKGVSYISATGKWLASLSYNGEVTSFGCFDTPEEANEVVKEAREILHGDFARHE